MKDHPLSFLWWDVQQKHFKLSESSIYTAIGNLDPGVAMNMQTHAKDLTLRVAACCDARPTAD